MIVTEDPGFEKAVFAEGSPIASISVTNSVFLSLIAENVIFLKPPLNFENLNLYLLKMDLHLIDKKYLYQMFDLYF